MTALKKKSSLVIFGGGLSGLALAARLEKAGLDYYLVESQDFGGLTKGQNAQNIELDYGLKSIPLLGSVQENPLVQLKNDLDLKFQIESFDDKPQFFSDKSFSEFVGFGESKKRGLIEDLAYYTTSPRLLVAGGWRILIEELLSLIPEKKRMTQAHLTKLEIQEDQVLSATLNGETVLSAEKFVCTFSPSKLRDIVNPGQISGKIIQRIARTSPLTAVSVDLATEGKISDAKNIFILREYSKAHDEEFYVVGQFVSNSDPIRQSQGHQTSTWMTLVEAEDLLEDENGSKIIKQIKKIVGKAFPTLLEKIKFERLLVVPEALGTFTQLTLEKNHTLPGLNNLWICGGKTQHAVGHISAALSSAKEVAQILVETTQAPSPDLEPVAEPLPELSP